MITTRQWMDLPQGVRSDISKKFVIKRSGATEVLTVGENSVVKSDGVLERDLVAVMPQFLAYLGLAEEPNNLLSLIQEKIYDRTEPIGEPEIGGEPVGSPVEDGTEAPQPRRRGRPRREAISLPSTSRSFGE